MRGYCSMSLPSMVAPTLEVSDWRSGSSAVTSTEVVVWARAREKLRVAVWLISRRISRRTCVWRPGAVTVT